ncbi:MAG: hypothetical protein V4561_02835 [Bacteroidota bacterium]
MKQQNIIAIPTNDTEYQFEISTNKEQSSQCLVSISFLSGERNWVLVFEDEKMLFNLGIWYFKRRELPEAILREESIISAFIKMQTETT